MTLENAVEICTLVAAAALFVGVVLLAIVVALILLVSEISYRRDEKHRKKRWATYRLVDTICKLRIM